LVQMRHSDGFFGSILERLLGVTASVTLLMGGHCFGDVFDGWLVVEAR